MRVLVIVIVVLALLGVGTVFVINSLGKRTTPTPTTTTTTTTTNTNTSTNTTTQSGSLTILTADPVVENENSRNRFAAAQEKVKSWSLWKTNAELSGLFMTFSSSLELNTANEVYVFDSSDDPDNHYTVSVAQASGNMLRAIIPTNDYQGPLLPIKQEFWQSNYVDAIQFADSNGGKAFREANTITTVDAKLYRVPPKNYLYWVVVYHTKDVTKSLTVKNGCKRQDIGIRIKCDML